MSIIEKNNAKRDLKFENQFRTASGDIRASVDFAKFETLWFNTGTLCNLACANCYIESTPLNDSLVYISLEEVTEYLDEILEMQIERPQIAFTGGEPFMNPNFLSILNECLSREFRVLVLTNAMKPMQHKKSDLLELKRLYGDAELVFRVSIDHYESAVHEAERGPKSWRPMIDGIEWLRNNDFIIKIAGRSLGKEGLIESRIGYGRLLRQLNLKLDHNDIDDLVIFPEMNSDIDVPEITEQCWNILSVSPESQMCSSSRMVIKRKGEAHPVVVSCTLLPYDTQFELGKFLKDSVGKVYLNHPNCSKFCVLGGASCSS
jgi:MoaA/NifB/PqqE/SkfB family radical SAM enzyme